ncbi:hypothetical protein ACOTFF_15900 [Achromobacter xylosoxidans]
MSKKLTWIGIAITAAYLVTAALLGWGEWDKFSEMKPNEVGDFLAGVVGPLALLWLILGYFQQGEELRNSAAALRLQAEELKASVRQQTELVSVTREQLSADRAALDAQYTPQLRLDVQRFTVFDDQTTIDFTLRNFGDVAQDVRIELRAFGLEFEQTFFDSIPTGEWVEVRLCGVTDSHSGSYSIPLQYKDRLSRSHMREIGLELKYSDDDQMGGVWAGVNQSL